MFNDFFIKQALIQAKIAFKKNEIPVGAIIVDNTTWKIIARAHNLVETKKNATFHAEILAINKACKILSSKYLTNYSIYTTLEPCGMCASAISHAKLSSLYYSAQDLKQGAVENGMRFFNSNSCFSQPKIYCGLGEKASEQLLLKFFREKIRN